MAQHGNLMDVDLGEQVAALRKELGVLRNAVSKSGSGLYEDAGDRVSDFLSVLSDHLPSMSRFRKQARAVEKVAYDHPAVVATVGLLVVGLVASLLIGGRRSAPPPAPKRNSGRRTGSTSRR